MQSICGLRDLFDHESVSEIKNGISQEAIKKANTVFVPKVSVDHSNHERHKSVSPINLADDRQFDSDAAFRNSSFEPRYDESDEYWSDNDCYYDSDVGDLYSRNGNLLRNNSSPLTSSANTNSDTNVSAKKRPYRSRVRSAFWKAAKKGASMSYKAAKSGLGSKSASKAIYRRYQSRRSRKFGRDVNFGAECREDMESIDAQNEVETEDCHGDAIPHEQRRNDGLDVYSTDCAGTHYGPKARGKYSESEDFFTSDPDDDSNEEWTSISVERSDKIPIPVNKSTQTYTFIPKGNSEIDDSKLNEPSATEILSSSSTTRQYLEVVENLDTTENLVVTVVEELDQQQKHKLFHAEAYQVNMRAPSSSTASTSEPTTSLSESSEKIVKSSDQMIQTIPEQEGDEMIIETESNEFYDNDKNDDSLTKQRAPLPALELCPLLASHRVGSVGYGYNMNTSSLAAEKLSARNRNLEASSKDCWAQMDASLFRVRGSSYLTDKVKVPGTSSLMHLAAVDWFSSDEIIQGIGSNKDGIVQQTLLKDNDNVFCFIINMQVPLGAQHRSLVLYYITTIDTVSDKDSLVWKFINGDDTFQAERFKLIPNIAFGPVIVKRSVGNKPLIVRNALSTNFVRGKNFFEVDINIGSSSVAFYVVKLVLGYVRRIVVDLVFLIQGNTEEELKDNESVIGTIRVSRLEPDACVDYPKG